MNKVHTPTLTLCPLQQRAPALSALVASQLFNITEYEQSIPKTENGFYFPNLYTILVLWAPAPRTKTITIYYHYFALSKIATYKLSINSALLISSPWASMMFCVILYEQNLGPHIEQNSASLNTS